MNTISIYYISSEIFQEIEYINIDDLNYQLKSLIIYHDSDLYIQLLINENILNDFNIMLILSNLTNYDFITIVFSQKKELYCLGNENGKYILDFKNDNYSKLLEHIIIYYNESYNIIKGSSYKNLIFLAVKQGGFSLKFASNELKNDKIFILEIFEKYNINFIEYISDNLKNDKDIVLLSVKHNGYNLIFASINLKNNKEIVLEAVKKNGLSLQFASDYLKNNNEIVLEAVRKNGLALQFASNCMKNNKVIVYEAVREDMNAFKFASNNLKNDKNFMLNIIIL